MLDDAAFLVPLPDSLEPVGVLLEPLTVAEKGIRQAFEIQRRLKVWRPARAAVLGAGTIGLLTARPAAVLGCAAGRLAKGAPADLCLFDPERAWQVEAGKLPWKAQNTPFDGRALEGVVLGTWKAGRRVF